MSNMTERCAAVAPFVPLARQCQGPDKWPFVFNQARRACAFHSQVVSFGPLGVLGRNGWFCREADVDRWNALAGFRGLRDPQVRQHFNGIFLAFEAEGWGPNQELINNLDLRYEVTYLGADVAPDAIQARLEAKLPTFFFLWSPHPFNTLYSLNRIQLPAYARKLFDQGLSDYPTDVLEKVASKKLAEFAPAVAELLSRFTIGNDAQESMLVMIGEGEVGLSTMHAVCSWMRKQSDVWQAWLPAEKGSCDIGNYAINEKSCAPCPPGSTSVGGPATACIQCPAGARPPSAHCCHSHAPFLAGSWVRAVGGKFEVGFLRTSLVHSFLRQMVQMAGLASCRFLSVPRGAGELLALRRLRRVLPRRCRTIGMQRMPGEHSAVLRDERLPKRKRLLVHARCVLL